ncbi:ABC transporter substrate-binding protein [Actinospica sp.]|uniref:ABC transporter substrate-binding protein n=1 Tax=Actinospica sp. TaxID=1872142 RepID=UPI002CE004A2|nr:extracellular solute-binding protein [Actinospica sp.]HWG24855.1 extracellular solute-binding protein [Actinospica sp.]
MSELSRRGFLGLGAGAAALAMAGCSDFTSSSSSSSSSDTLVFRWWGGTARNEAYQSALKVFTQKTGIKVTAQYSGYNGYFDKLNTEFAGGTPPDVFQMDTALTSTYAAKGVLSDLSKYIPGTIALNTLFTQLRTAGTVKGVNYGIASGSGYAPVLYNETVLGKLKIAYPENSWTWDDFTAITNEVAKAWGSGKYGAMDASGDDSGAMQPWLRQRGKDLYTQAGELGFDSNDLGDWWNYWAGLRKTGACCPADLVANYGNADSTNPFVSGSVALTNGWGLSQIAPLMTASLGEIIVPRGTNGKTGQALNGGVLLVIPTKSANPTGAAKLIDFFLTDKDAVKIMSTQRGLPPSTLAENELLPTLSSSAKTDVTYGDYVNQQVATDALANPPSAPPGYGDVKTALGNVSSAVAFGKQSVSGGVSSFFGQAKTILAQAAA